LCNQRNNVGARSVRRLHVVCPITDERSARDAPGSFQRLSILGQALRQDHDARASRRSLETVVMPKVIVLFFGAESFPIALAEAAAEGATRVRFTEVDLQRVSNRQASSAARERSLNFPHRIQDYDGVIVVCPAADTPMAMSQMLDEMESEAPDAFTHTVFGVVGAESRPGVLARVARLGGLTVTVPRAIEDAEAGARALGTRVATVVGWVRHALSHDHH
jgi:hypothetical protein